MESMQTKRIIEALLVVVGQPLALKRITEVLPDLAPAQVRSLIQTLNAEYEQGQRAFRVQEVAGGYQLVTDQELAPWIKRALASPRPDAVSTAALETLAIIAYRQPITKAEIEAIRGVDVSASLDTLVERGFAKISGRKETPGRPFLYGTTAEFLRHFGLNSVDALPGLTLPAVAESGSEPGNPPLAGGPGQPHAAAGGTAEPAAAAADRPDNGS